MATKNNRNWWLDRSEDRDTDAVLSLRISAEFEREMLALVPNPIDDGEVDDVRDALEHCYDRYAKGGV